MAFTEPDTPAQGDSFYISTARLVTFSDGVFAIAITLLVFSLKVPEVASGRLEDAIRAMVPEFTTYVFTFIVIGLFWMQHHRIFHYIVRVNNPLLWLNILFLLLIAFVPFPSAMLMKYSNAFALVFYAVTLVVIALLAMSMWEYAVFHRRLVENNLPAAVIRRGRAGTISFIVLFSAFTIVSMFSPEGAKYLLIALFIYRWAVRRKRSRREHPSPHRSN